MKRITKNTLKSYMKSFNDTISYTLTYDDKTIDVEVKNKLTLSEIASIVEEVSSSCFINDVYHPEYVDTVFFSVILNRLTNIDVLTLDNESIDLDGMAQLLSASNINEIIYQNENIHVLRHYCDDAIEWKKQTILKHSKLDDLVDEFSELSKALQDEQFQEAIKQINEAQK